jgi:hypothetical protein
MSDDGDRPVANQELKTTKRFIMCQATWTKEMARWLELSRYLDYLQDQYEMADVMGDMETWRENRQKAESEQESLFAEFTDRQKETLFR